MLKSIEYVRGNVQVLDVTNSLKHRTNYFKASADGDAADISSAPKVVRKICELSRPVATDNDEIVKFNLDSGTAYVDGETITPTTDTSHLSQGSQKAIKAFFDNGGERLYDAVQAQMDLES